MLRLYWTTLGILIFFAGCGTGGDSVDRILDPTNPTVVKNVAAYSAFKRIRLVWTPTDETSIVGYNIYRSTDVAAGFELIGSVGQSSAPSYNDEGPDTTGDGIPDGLSNNVTHFYKVTAFDRSGRESPVELSPSTAATPGQLPNETIDLQVQNVTAWAGRSQAFVAWERLDDERIYGYSVYRKISGSSNEPVLASMTGPEVSSWNEGGLSDSENYVYIVAPVVNEIADDVDPNSRSGLLEGRPVESRSVQPDVGDDTIPKPPGTAPNAPYSVTAQTHTESSHDGILVQWTRPTANTDGSILADNDDLIDGSYLIYRSSQPYNQYKLIGIHELAGQAASLEFFDRFGTRDHYYVIRAADSTGNISNRSDIVSANREQSPPPAVKLVDAYSGANFGQIEIRFQPVNTQSISGYNIYRSGELNSGYEPIASGILDNDSNPDNFIRYFDSSNALNLNNTYYYKISTVSNFLESSLSPAASATPGPSNGIVVLEGENAVVLNQGTGATSQFFPDHYADDGEISAGREGLGSNFSGSGVLRVEPQFPALSNVPQGERLDLVWQTDIRSRLSEASSGQVIADVYMITADQPGHGRYQLFLDDKEIPNAIPPGTEGPNGIDLGFDGIVTEIDFNDPVNSTQLQPTRRLIGRLTFNHILDPTSPFPGSDITGLETLHMSLLHKGPTATCSPPDCGTLKVDALILVIQ